MKTKITLFTLLLTLSTCFGQWAQVGSDIDGDDNGEWSSRSVNLSADGNTLAIGAFNHDNYKGTTRIYSKSGANWVQVGADIDGVDSGERSGRSVSLSADGTIVAIGAQDHDAYKGTTRIYSKSGANWVQVGADIDGVETEASGWSVSLSADGNTVAIGAYIHDVGKGTTRIYTNSGGTWTQIGSDIDGVNDNEYSGYSVSLSADGNTVAIGVPEHVSSKGTTRIYTISGNTWTQVGGDIDGGDANERSGSSISLSSDGNTIAIGAYEHDSGKGTTRVYTNSGGTWGQVNSDIDGMDVDESSGFSVSLSSDGSTVAIGALAHDSSVGSTRIYKNNGGTWEQVGDDIDGMGVDENSGFSVSLSSDGSAVAIGAPYHDSGKGTTRVYINLTLSIDPYDIIEGLEISISNGKIVSNLDSITIQVYTILGQEINNNNLKPSTIYIVKSTNTKGQKQVNKLYF